MNNNKFESTDNMNGVGADNSIERCGTRERRAELVESLSHIALESEGTAASKSRADVDNGSDEVAEENGSQFSTGSDGGPYSEKEQPMTGVAEMARPLSEQKLWEEYRSIREFAAEQADEIVKEEFANVDSTDIEAVNDPAHYANVMKKLVSIVNDKAREMPGMRRDWIAEALVPSLSSTFAKHNLRANMIEESFSRIYSL
jgi:hypothetical protein